jgi:hypothetical protein
MSHLWQAAAGQRLPLQTSGYHPRERMPQGSAISTLSVPLRHTGLEPNFRKSFRVERVRPTLDLDAKFGQAVDQQALVLVLREKSARNGMG